MLPTEKKFREALSTGIIHHIQDKEEKQDVLEWVKRRKLVNEVGNRIEFSNHAFLADIFSDMSPRQVWLKGSQIGLTTTQVFKTIWLSEKRGFQIIYTMPTVEHVQKIVGSKVDKILSLNRGLRDSMGAGRDRKDTTYEKHFGLGVIHYLGTFKEVHGISITSDLNLHDELDRSDLGVVEIYESRLQHSRYKGQWMFSNPSYPEIGVDFFWRMSDQKHWFVKCPSCNCYQYIDWFGIDYDNVDKEQKEYVCHKCRRVIEDDTRRQGFWVPKQKGQAFSGYWIPQTIAPWMSCADVLYLEETKTSDYFHNFCLGLPYRGTDRVVSEDMIWRALLPAADVFHDNVCMGVDQGGTEDCPVYHAVIGNEFGIWEMRVFHTDEELDNYIAMSGAFIVMDGNPKPSRVKVLREKYKHKAWAAFYKNDPKQMDLVRWKDKEGHILIARDKAIDNLIDQFIEGKIKIAMPKGDPVLRDYIKHWGTMGLYTMTDALGNERNVWKSSTGQDHYVHATLYYMVARERQKLYRKRPEKEEASSRIERYKRRNKLKQRIEDV